MIGKARNPQAKQNIQVKRMMTHGQRYELVAIDQVGYVPLADIVAELLFQVISDLLGPGYAGGVHRDNQLAVLRVDDGVSKCAILQGAVGPDHGSCTHHRNRDGVVPVPADSGKEKAEVNADGRRRGGGGSRPVRLHSG